MYFDILVAKQNFPVALQDNEKMSRKGLGMMRNVMEMDVGDGLTWPWSCWRIWEKGKKAQV